LKTSSAYTIQFVGLSNGIHYFDFEADKEFFNLIHSELISNGNVAVKLELEKNNHTLTLQFHFEGTVDTLCDRCAIDYAYPISGNSRLIVKTAGEAYEEQDEIVTLPKGSFEIDLSQFIFDSIALSMPLRIVPCENLENQNICDQDVIKRIDQINTSAEDDTVIDPRWAKLNQIKK
jgi:uncharacterized metal-binding protein YceD (DUF177 family)